VPPDIAERIGTDAEDFRPTPVGETKRGLGFGYQEQKGDYRLRLLPPLYLEHVRGLGTASEDREQLVTPIYYRRRSPKADADVLFPLAWRIRDDASTVTVVGPVAHREAPGEHDNWLFPLVFEGERKDGGYLHTPLLLTTTHWNADKAFSLTGPYFRDRRGSDVDWGVAPFVFHGDNGSVEGARKTYTLIPPLLFYDRWREVDESATTSIGPVLWESTPKRRVFDVLPLFFRITGANEHHTTLLPLFHYGRGEEQSLLVLPGYLRRRTRTVDTMLTPLFSYSTTRNEATTFLAIGPLLPLFLYKNDKDTGARAITVAPLFHASSSAESSAFLTPLYGRFEDKGASKSQWLFPTFTWSSGVEGWETDLHPLLYFGRNRDQSSHTVVAPIFWDFASPASRTTIGVPAYFRQWDSATDSVLQVAANTLYRQRRVPGGLDWEFHLLPLLSYGQEPKGHFWNVLFGLAGYSRSGGNATVRALWIPIPVATEPVVSKEASGAPRTRAE